MIKEGDIVITKANSWMGVIESCRGNPSEYEVKWFVYLSSGASASFMTGENGHVLRLYEQGK